MSDPAGVEKRWADVLDTPLADLGIDVVDAAADTTAPAQTDGIVEIRLDRPQLPPGATLQVGTIRLRN